METYDSEKFVPVAVKNSTRILKQMLEMMYLKSI
jgi:hypothetical protein